jgi:diguanylate cyclase (GGDEF)-like protein
MIDANAIPDDEKKPLDVLVVDDDAASRAAVCAAVRSLGHQCRPAAGGADALDLHTARRADVIVSDWSMPGMDGMEVCRRVRALDHGTYTYLLFTSGHANKRDFVQAVRAGADDCLPKPIDIDDLEARLLAARRVVRAYRTLAQLNEGLRHDSRALFRAARVDPLTGISNRRRLDEDLEAIQSHVSRYHRGVSFAMCDLDGFKGYNDHFGHPAGDHALRRIARAIRKSVRRADHVYRYGGEEFLVILPEQSRDDAAVAMNRARESVASLGILHAPGAKHPVVTISIGIAYLGPEGDHAVSKAVARSDLSLFRAKAAGGNQVAVEAEVLRASCA